MIVLKVVLIGSHEVIVLNEEIKKLLNVKLGDSVRISMQSNGAIQIAPVGLVESQLEIAEKIMKDDDNILRALAQVPESGFKSLG